MSHKIHPKSSSPMNHVEIHGIFPSNRSSQSSPRLIRNKSGTYTVGNTFSQKRKNPRRTESEEKRFNAFRERTRNSNMARPINRGGGKRRKTSKKRRYYR